MLVGSKGFRVFADRTGDKCPENETQRQMRHERRQIGGKQRTVKRPHRRHRHCHTEGNPERPQRGAAVFQADVLPCQRLPQAKPGDTLADIRPRTRIHYQGITPRYREKKRRNYPYLPRQRNRHLRPVHLAFRRVLCLNTPLCESGGTGRRTGFRFQRGNP